MKRYKMDNTMHDKGRFGIVSVVVSIQRLIIVWYVEF